VPAFYKINLYNEIYKKASIQVVFVSLHTNISMFIDNFKNKIIFPYHIINKCSMEERNIFLSMVTMARILRKYKFKKIIICGWDLPEFQMLFFLSSRFKNCLELESSIIESKTSGFIGLVKRILVSRIAIALPPGKPHTKLLRRLGFRGTCRETGGVGIFNKILERPQKVIRVIDSIEELRFLYVGRLVSVKNLHLLINTFNTTGYKLTIVGYGPLEEELKCSANNNIKFMGKISNDVMDTIYESHDVLILPSNSETWGLVIEEAIYYGLPVIVSNAVSCQNEMVKDPGTGVVFQSNNVDSLIVAIKKLYHNYDVFQRNTLKFDFDRRDVRQVDSYLMVLNI